MQATFRGSACNAVDEVRTGVGPSTAIRLLRDAARKVIYRSGALSLYHRLRNRQVLTVAAFHRVLKRDDPRWETALTPWTVSDDIFDQCLVFFKRHYTLVTLDDVKASLEGARPLPARSLLITFDDGFADVSDYALPLLRKHNASATVFISSDVVGRDERLWTEDLLWAFTAGRLHQRDLACLHALLIGGSAYDAADPKLIWNIVRRGPDLEQAEVESALATLKIDLHRIRHPRQMLTKSEVANLAFNGISIGAHGKSHTALPFASNIAIELCWPRVVLNDLVAPHHHGSIDALSFPHGAYTSEIVDHALASGYRLAFTSDAELCVLSTGFLMSPLLGRIDVDARRIAPTGTFRPEMLATTFFTAAWRQAGLGSRNISKGQDRPIRAPHAPSSPMHRSALSVPLQKEGEDACAPSS
jgi:peptidoglycan/xylan/chitin deacetylase (PgdA/CDA1 family)